MHFEKETPKWFRIVYSILLALLGIFSVCLLFMNQLSTPFVFGYTLIFVIFNIIMIIIFLGKKYELRSWAVPICFIVFGFVAISLINTFSSSTTTAGIYFLHFIKTVFLWLFILLALIAYLHPHVKKVQEIKKKEKKPKKEKKKGKKKEEKQEELTEETTEIEAPKI